jgi:hypothetical protein
MAPNVVLEPPTRSEATRAPNSKRSAAVGRSALSTGWASIDQPAQSLEYAEYALRLGVSVGSLLTISGGGTKQVGKVSGRLSGQGNRKHLVTPRAFGLWTQARAQQLFAHWPPTDDESSP